MKSLQAYNNNNSKFTAIYTVSCCCAFHFLHFQFSFSYQVQNQSDKMLLETECRLNDNIRSTNITHFYYTYSLQGLIIRMILEVSNI